MGGAEKLPVTKPCGDYPGGESHGRIGEAITANPQEAWAKNEARWLAVCLCRDLVGSALVENAV